MSPGREVIAYCARHFDRTHDRLATALVVAFERDRKRKQARQHRGR